MQSTNQNDLSIQTNSSITIEPIKPINDLKKPKVKRKTIVERKYDRMIHYIKVLGNITPFSWPKFARAQDDYAKKYPEKCRLDAGNQFSSDISDITFCSSLASSQVTKAATVVTSSKVSSTNANSSMSYVPILTVSPPRAPKPMAGPVWKCPSCTMEHPAQTASCSLCHGINPNYKRLSGSSFPSVLESRKYLPYFFSN